MENSKILFSKQHALSGRTSCIKTAGIRCAPRDRPLWTRHPCYNFNAKANFLKCILDHWHHMIFLDRFWYPPLPLIIGIEELEFARGGSWILPNLWYTSPTCNPGVVADSETLSRDGVESFRGE